MELQEWLVWGQVIATDSVSIEPRQGPPGLLEGEGREGLQVQVQVRQGLCRVVSPVSLVVY